MSAQQPAGPNTPSADLIATEKVDIVTPLVCLGIGGLLVWFGIRALDPAWTIQLGAHGFGGLALGALKWLSTLVSPTVRGIAIIGAGVLALLFAVFGMLRNMYWRDPMLIIDANGIESLDGKGKGRLAWKDVATVRVVDDVLRVNGAGGNDISVETEDLDKDEEAIFSAIRRHRPDVLPDDSRAAAAQSQSVAARIAAAFRRG
jgi:hypothetical protein